MRHLTKNMKIKFLNMLKEGISLNVYLFFVLHRNFNFFIEINFLKSIFNLISRHTDTSMLRPDVSATKKEYTTQKIRQEWAEHEETIFPADDLEPEENWKTNPEDESKVFRPIASEATTVESSINKTDTEKSNDLKTVIDDKPNKEESKSKKKRRKKSVLKKKNIQRKNSTSSSAGSVNLEQQQDQDTESMTVSNNTSN